MDSQSVKTTGVGGEQRGYQEQAAKGYMSLDELGVALEELEKTRKAAERELEMLRHHKEHLERLERARDELLDSLTDMAPDALGALGPEDRQQVYKMLRLKVTVSQDGSMKISGAFGDNFSVCESERAPRCTTQITKKFEIEFHALLNNSTREICFERVVG